MVSFLIVCQNFKLYNRHILDELVTIIYELSMNHERVSQDILLHDSAHLLWCYDTPSKVSFNQVNIFASASQTINHAHVGSTGIGILMICAGVEWKGDQHALRNIHGIISQ